MSTITIPAELVPLVRDGCYSDLPAGDARGEGLDERARGARALLDVLGWQDPVDEPYAIDVDVDVCEHREALLRALLTRVGVASGVEGDEHTGVGQRAEAKVHVGQLAGLVQQVEEGGE
ncbi:MAG: hypothetical protein ABSH36_07740 [Solirubrobacteraceae bacterium]